MDKEEVVKKIGELWEQCELDPTEVLAIIGETMDCNKCPAGKICDELDDCRRALLKYLGYKKDPVEATVF